MMRALKDKYKMFLKQTKNDISKTI